MKKPNPFISCLLILILVLGAISIVRIWQSADNPTAHPKQDSPAYTQSKKTGINNTSDHRRPMDDVSTSVDGSREDTASNQQAATDGLVAQQANPKKQDNIQKARVLPDDAADMDAAAKNPILHEIAKSVRTLPNGDMKTIRLVRMLQDLYPIRRIVEVSRIDQETGEEVTISSTSMVGDHLMVKLSAHSDEATLNDLAKSIDGGIRRKMRAPNLYLIEIPADQIGQFEQSMAFLNGSKHVVSIAEPDYMIQIMATPNDPNYANGDLWGMHNTGQSSGLADADIDAPEAWDIATGSHDVLVGVIDTGIDRDHPDLAANMWANPGETGLDGSGNDKRTNGIDDDGNGYTDDWRGWDFHNNDNDPHDDQSHGTHVAGTIGAVGNNGLGVSGICWSVSLVGVKFLSQSGSGYSSNAVESVYYATKLGVDMTCNSWGGGTKNLFLQEAIEDAEEHDILFITAAGNDSTNNDNIPQYPASYDVDNIIAVAASNRNDELAYFSNYGVISTDLAAPGAEILSTAPGGGYSLKSGTSMATPLVTGVCALLKSHRLNATSIDIKDAVMKGVDALASLDGKCVTGGRINAYKALGALDSWNVAKGHFTDGTEDGASGNSDGLLSPGERIGYYPTIANLGLSTVTGITVEASLPVGSPLVIVENNLLIGDVAPGARTTAATPFLFDIPVNTPTPDQFTLTITATDSNGMSAVREVALNVYTSSNVSGTVTLDGAPLPGVAIVYSGSSSEGVITTGADGSYSLALATGECSLFVRHQDFFPAIRNINLTTPQTGINFDFLTTDVSGRITDLADGSPIAGVDVLVDGEIPGNLGPIRGILTSDSNGYYSFSEVFADVVTLTLIVDHDTYSVETKEITIPPSTSNADFQLGASKIDVDKRNISVTAAHGQVLQRDLLVTNSGNKTLNWSAQTDYEFREIPYQWIDISGTGTEVLNGSYPIGSQPMRGPQAVTFDFPYYGRFYDILYVSQYGTISFDPTARERIENQSFPYLGTSQAFKKSTLSLYWSDFIDGNYSFLFGGFPWGDIYVQQLDSETYVVQMQDRVAPSFTTNKEGIQEINRVTAQAIIKADGTLRYYYKYVHWGLRNHSIGIQNHDSSKGTTFKYVPGPGSVNHEHIGEFYTPSTETGYQIDRQLPEWLTLSSTGGSISPSGNDALTIELDSGRAPIGTNTYTLGLKSNDPLEPRKEITITFTVTPTPVPGTIQAEHYDEGIEAETYNDTTAKNLSGAYRTDKVDIANLGDGYCVRAIEAGEWLNYSVDVAQTALYDITVQASSQTTGGNLHVEFDGIDVTGTMTVPATGNWNNYTSITASNVPLNAGPQAMRLVAETNGFNVDFVTITPSTENLAPQISSVWVEPSPTTLANATTAHVIVSDEDMDGLSYIWSLESGTSGVTFGEADAASTSVSFPSLGNYLLRVTVTDLVGNSSSDTVNIVVQEPNRIPEVNAGPDQQVKLSAAIPESPPVSGAFFEWDAASDTDGDVSWQGSTDNNYSWSFASESNLSPVPISDPSLDKLTHAYEFPAARSGSETSLEGFINASSSGTWEFVLDVDNPEYGVIMESGGEANGFQFYLIDGNLKGVLRGDGENAVVSHTLSDIEMSGFIHVVYVIDQEAETFNLYINNMLMDSASWVGTDWCGTDPAGLGSHHGEAPGATFFEGYNFEGKIALMRFYDSKAFTAAEVTTNFHAVSSGTSGNVMLNGTVTELDGDAYTSNWEVIDTVPAGLRVDIFNTSNVDTTAMFYTAGIYTLELTADDGITDAGSDQVVITITDDMINPGGTFANWIAGFEVGVLDGFDHDPDGDGISNGLENYFGTDPSQASFGVIAGNMDHATNTFHFSHPLNDTPASDLVANYRWSTDLVSFHDDGASNQNDTTTVDFTQGIPTGGWVNVSALIDGSVIPGRLFIEIMVSQQ